MHKIKTVVSNGITIIILYQIYLCSLPGHWAAVFYSSTTEEHNPLVFLIGVIDVYDQQGEMWDQS